MTTRNLENCTTDWLTLLSRLSRIANARIGKPQLMKLYDFSRFLQRVEIGNELDCWEWTGDLNQSGYGRFFLNGERMGAHRASYILENGSIPNGLFILHKCNNRKCVNPAHLVAGTQSENVQDTVRAGRARGGFAPRPTCNKGHPWTPASTGKTSSGYRTCVICRRAAAKKRYTNSRM